MPGADPVPPEPNPRARFKSFGTTATDANAGTDPGRDLVAHLAVQLVGQGLEENGGGRDLLATRVVAVGEMPAAGQVQAHDTVVGLEQGRVDGKVGGAALGKI